MKFLKSHEWFRIEDGIATVGITDFAQQQLNDIVFVELPEVGRTVEKLTAVAVVESCKTAADVYSPVSGEIVEVNAALNDQPDLVNAEPTGGGWLFKVRVVDFDATDAAYLDQAAYEAALADA